MAKNINPLTTRLLKKDYWYINSLPFDETPTIGSANEGYINKGSNDIVQYQYIKNLIHGSFLKIGILTSEIRISKNCLASPLLIQFLYYPLVIKTTFTTRREEEPVSNQNQIVDLLKIIKLILNLKYPFYNIKFVCVKAPHKFLDTKILNDFIQFSSTGNPNRLKFTLLSIIKEFRKYRFNYINRKYLTRRDRDVNSKEARGNFNKETSSQRRATGPLKGPQRNKQNHLPSRREGR